MALANLPVWTLRPNWADGVLERLEWLTTILAGRSGAEQRIAQRLSPRRVFDLSLVLSGPERALFDLSVGRVGAGEWWVPLWHAGVPVTTSLVAGATFAVTPTIGREWVAPGAALLLGRSALDYEIAEVVAVGAGGISFASGLSRTWGPGSKLYPLRRGELMEPPKATRKTEAVATAQARFRLTEPDDYTPLAWPDTYRGMPVLAARPDETTNLSLEYARLTAELDTETGRRHVVDLAPDISVEVQQHAWFLQGTAEHADFRALLHALQGRLTPVWLPTHSTDLELAATAAGGASAITVRECGYTAFDSIRPGRRDVRIELRDGSAVHRRITASAAISGDRESLTLDAPLVSGVAPVDVARISFMALARLDQDAVEIAHKTDLAGVSTVVSAFRTTPESRVAEAWTPLRSPFIVKTPWLCGAPHDCTALGAWAMAYMVPTHTEFTEPESTIGSPALGCVGGHRICWYAGYRVAVTPDGWTPQLLAALAAVPPFDPYNGILFAYRAVLSARLRNAILAAAADGDGSRSAVICGAQILAVGEVHGAWARNSLGVDDIGRHIAVVIYSTTRQPSAHLLSKGVEVRDGNGVLLKHEIGTYAEYPVSGGGWLYLAEFFGDLDTMYYNIYDPAATYRTNVDWYANRWAIPTTPYLATVPV